MSNNFVFFIFFGKVCFDITILKKVNWKNIENMFFCDFIVEFNYNSKNFIFVGLTMNNFVFKMIKKHRIWTFFMSVVFLFLPFQSFWASTWRDYLWNSKFQTWNKIIYTTDWTDKYTAISSWNKILIYKLSWNTWTWLSSDSVFSWTNFDFKYLNSKLTIAFDDVDFVNKISVYTFDWTNWNLVQTWISQWDANNIQLNLSWTDLIVSYLDLTNNKLWAKIFSWTSFVNLQNSENYTDWASEHYFLQDYNPTLTIYNDISLSNLNLYIRYLQNKERYNSTTNPWQANSSWQVSNIIAKNVGSDIFLSYKDAWRNNWIVVKYYNWTNWSVIWSPDWFFTGLNPTSFDMELSWNDVYLAMIDNWQIKIAKKDFTGTRWWISNPISWFNNLNSNIDLNFEWTWIILSFIDEWWKSSVLKSTTNFDITPENFQDFDTITGADLNVSLTSNIQIITWITVLTEVSVSWDCLYRINWWDWTWNNQYLSSWDTVQMQTTSPNDFDNTKKCELTVWTKIWSWTIITRWTWNIAIINPTSWSTITNTKPTYQWTAYSWDIVVWNLDWTQIFSVIATWWNWSWTQTTDLSSWSHTLVIEVNDWNWHIVGTTWSTFIVKTDFVPQITISTQYTTWNIIEITWTIDLTWSDLQLSILWPTGSIVSWIILNNVATNDWKRTWLNLTATWYYDVLATWTYTTWWTTYTWYDNTTDELLIYSGTNTVNNDDDLLLIVYPTDWQAFSSTTDTYAIVVSWTHTLLTWITLNWNTINYTDKVFSWNYTLNEWNSIRLTVQWQTSHGKIISKSITVSYDNTSNNWSSWWGSSWWWGWWGWGGGWWWGWGWWWSYTDPNEDYCPNWDYSWDRNDWTCEANSWTWDNTSTWDDTSDDENSDSNIDISWLWDLIDWLKNLWLWLSDIWWTWWKPLWIPECYKFGDITNSPFNIETNEAYLYSYCIDITTLTPIQASRLNDNIKRKDFAKMIVNFAIKRFNLKPDFSRKCNFIDMYNQNEERKKYAKLACQLWIMGLQEDWTPDVVFNPDKLMTRAMVGTTISRLLFRWAFNIKKWEPYHRRDKHLLALKKVWIMTKIDNPREIAKRWHTMLMLYRADKFFNLWKQIKKIDKK